MASHTEYSVMMNSPYATTTRTSALLPASERKVRSRRARESAPTRSPLNAPVPSRHPGHMRNDRGSHRVIQARHDGGVGVDWPPCEGYSRKVLLSSLLLGGGPAHGR